MKNYIYISIMTRSLPVYANYSCRLGKNTEMAHKNTEATDTSTLFEGQHFRNARNTVERSKASNTLLYVFAHAAMATISAVPSVFCATLSCTRSPFILFATSPISAPSFSQRPKPPYFRVKIHPLSIMWPEGPCKAGFS